MLRRNSGMEISVNKGLYWQTIWNREMRLEYRSVQNEGAWSIWKRKPENTLPRRNVVVAGAMYDYRCPLNAEIFTHGTPCRVGNLSSIRCIAYSLTEAMQARASAANTRTGQLAWREELNAHVQEHHLHLTAGNIFSTQRNNSLHVLLSRLRLNIGVQTYYSLSLSLSALLMTTYTYVYLASTLRSHLPFFLIAAEKGLHKRTDSLIIYPIPSV